MNNQYWAERRMIDAATKRNPQDIDRFEDEGGPGPEDTRHQRPDDAPVVPMEAAQPELPQPIAGPKCGGEDIPMHEAAWGRRPEPGDRHGRCHGPLRPGPSPRHSRAPSHGESPESAAANLAQDLAREIDGAADDLHREPLQRALDDVKASIERST